MLHQVTIAQNNQTVTYLVINELMASNNSAATDPQGQYEDWIEIHNFGRTSIDAGGMFLTDDLSAPTKWRIPNGTVISSGGYIVIWADEDVSDSGLHADFKLDAAGEEIVLFAADGVTLIDSVTFGEQPNDISYGRFPDATDNWSFLTIPTPGTTNHDAFAGQAGPPIFSHSRGFYDRTFYVTITTETEDAVIYYTLDGSVPYDFEQDNPTGTRYTGPIRIGSTTCLRAVATKSGWLPSAIHTNTYLMNASNAIRSLPVVSLVGDAGKTFYEPDGVMAIVGGYYNNGVWVSSGPNSYNNPMQRGLERPVSFEFIKPQDNSGFQVDCGIRVHGSDYLRPRYVRRNGVWSGNAKFSFRLYFRGEYGQSWLEYPLFPFEVERFKSIVLRGGHNDNTNPFIKDELIRRLHKDMGHVDCGGTLANIFINGEYKGYFNPCEHIKNEFCQEWYNSNLDFDVMTMSGVRDGDSAAWNEMLNFARNNNLADQINYREMGMRLDITGFIDYLILQLWCANWDWPNNNWSAARERSEKGLWRFFVWDAEGTMESGDISKVGFNQFPSWQAGGGGGLNGESTPIAYLYRALKANNNFRQLFADRIYKHFYNGGALSDVNIRKRFLELRDEMLGVLPNMDMYTLNTWVPNRLSIFQNAAKADGMYTSNGPEFNINGIYQHGGNVSAGDILTLTTSGRSTNIYYTIDGPDPRVGGTSNLGQDTSTTLVAENFTKRVLVPTGNISDNWKGGATFNDSAWLICSGAPGGVGYERGSGYESYISLDLEDIMYTGNTGCYIRIPFTFDGNPGDYNLMTVKMRYDDGFVTYLNGTEIARRNFTGTPTWNSLAESNHEADAVESIYISDYINALRRGTNILAIHGLNISTTSSDFIISAALVIDKADLSNGGEIALQALEYNGPVILTYSTNIKTRLFINQAWSALNEATFCVGPVAENLRITEIMYHPQSATDDDPNEEFIELSNIGAEPINLNLVTFTNGIDFTFGNVELLPGEYTVVVENQDAFEARYGLGVTIAGEYSGKLSNSGERIRLADALGRTIIDFSYEDDWYPDTDGDDFSLNVINPANPDPDSWSNKESWQSSTHLGGSPGQDD